MNEIKEQLNRIEKMLNQLVEGQETPTPIEQKEGYEKHVIRELECYVSRSGNITYKAWTDNLDLIYLRQSHKTMLTEAGLWGQLEKLEVDEKCKCEIVIHTIPDGDFKKPVKIDKGGILELFDSMPESVTRLKRVVDNDDYIILDTETTDLDGYVYQLSILDSDGVILLNTLVKPPAPISPGASCIHGITNKAVENAPTLGEITQLPKLLSNKNIIGWNIDFDKQAIIRSANSTDKGVSIIEAINQSTFVDAMLPFSEIYGEWNDYFGNYKWQKLTTASSYYGISTEGAHDALADCRMTLAVLKKMVEKQNDNQTNQHPF